MDKSYRRRGIRTRNLDGDPNPSDSSSDDEFNPKVPRRITEPRQEPSALERFKKVTRAPLETARFDLKLKSDDVPEWDGDEDSLGLWILKLNSLAQRSERVYEQLGQIVPTRFRNTAETWYYSLPYEFRQQAEADWGYFARCYWFILHEPCLA